MQLFFLWCTSVACARPEANATFLYMINMMPSVKIKYGKEVIARYAKFVYYNYNLVRESVKLYL